MIADLIMFLSDDENMAVVFAWAIFIGLTLFSLNWWWGNHD